MKQKFLIGFHEYMVRRNTLIPNSGPTRAGFLVFTIISNFRLEVYPRSRDDDIVIRLYMSGKNAKTHFHALKKQQPEIEDEFGELLEWDELCGRKYCKVSLSKKDANLMDETRWSDHYEWLASKLEQFNKVFRPRVANF